jgi:hypothetical protein
MAGDQRQQPQPHRIGHGLEQRSELVGPGRRQRLGGQRRAALSPVGVDDGKQSLVNHPSNLTHL